MGQGDIIALMRDGKRRTRADIISELPDHNPRTLGANVTAAKNNGTIRVVDVVRKSNNRGCHRYVYQIA